MIVDDIKLYTVLLGNFGSGVLFQANVKGPTYVLTAKHNLKKVEIGQTLKITINTRTDTSWGKEEIDYVRNDGKNYFSHPDERCDAVILTIPYRPGYDQIIIQNNFCNELKYNLCGYPNDKTKTGQPHEFLFKAHTIESFKDSKDFLQAGITTKNQIQENLMGISGGGIFGLGESHLVLLGIQSEIAKSTNPEGEFDYIPIRFFNEIIDDGDNAKLLDPLLPGYMKDLLSLGSSIMELNECFDVGFKASVRSLMDSKLKDIKHTPKEILASSIKEKMLVANESDAAYQSKVLWTSWLEFLLILSVAEREMVDVNALEKVFKSIRLIHSDTDESWQMIIKDILDTDYSEQDAESVVLVSTRQRPSANFTIDKGMVPDIADARGIGMDIGRAEQLSLISKFVHIKAFETQCIEKNESELSKLKGTRVKELLEAIKTKFNELLSN